MSTQQINVAVDTLSGGLRRSFSVKQPLRQVIDATFEHLRIRPAQGELWQLRHEGAVLDPARTIEATGLKDQTVLKLAPREGGGG
jgi:hypothetical protein